ncbi:hypothetical protein [Burkholderia vietnamiensis]|uniref:hypothetical protein n=1 Tax=Burkholderia vietnamiensis TaxID=60552 RepID=UPI00158CE0BD|nr:hypothetical protein [Burkholderia vietnamiensis]
MGMHCDESVGDKIIEGTICCKAVRHHGRDVIEVWSEDFEQLYGNVPATFTVAHINIAAQFFLAGVLAGEQGGRKALQTEAGRLFDLGLA